jgi:hypothetical protein
MKSVRDKVRDRVWTTINFQVWSQVSFQVDERVNDQVWSQLILVIIQIQDKILDQVRAKP